MRALRNLRDLAFRVRFGFRGAPFRIQNHTIRLDESLRRWDASSEAHVQDILISELKPGDCLLDVGANFGLHSLLGGRIVHPNGRVYAFEPLPANLHLLQHHVRINHLESVLQVVPAAVSDSPENQVSFFSGAEAAGVTASLARSGGNLLGTTVNNIRLDDYQANISGPVRLLKIDVEGAELKVLRGARRLLASHKPVLVIEVHLFAFPDFGYTREEFQQFLADLGYREEILPGTEMRQGQHYQAIYRPIPSSTKAS